MGLLWLYKDNGAVRAVATDVKVTVGSDGRTSVLSIPATVRQGLVGSNTLFAKVQDVAGATEAAAQTSDQGYVRFGNYTVTSQSSIGTFYHLLGASKRMPTG